MPHGTASKFAALAVIISSFHPSDSVFGPVDRVRLPYTFIVKNYVYAGIGNPSERLPANANGENITSVVLLILKELWCSHLI